MLKTEKHVPSVSKATEYIHVYTYIYIYIYIYIYTYIFLLKYFGGLLDSYIHIHTYTYIMVMCVCVCVCQAALAGGRATEPHVPSRVRFGRTALGQGLLVHPARQTPAYSGVPDLDPSGP